MKVFLSWSGEESKQLAQIFKEWLPNVLQYVDPYISSKDIAYGERWANSISNSLSECVFGLIFVTPENINAPWLNFEAGALSKTYDSRVVPILYKSDITILNDGPLKQFQSSINLEKDNLLNLINTINDKATELKLNERRLNDSFEIWWDRLSEDLTKVKTKVNEGNQKEETIPEDDEMLRVIYSKLIKQDKKTSLVDNHFSDIRPISNSFIREFDIIKETLHLLLEKNVSGEDINDDELKNVEDTFSKLPKMVRHLKRHNRDIIRLKDIVDLE